MARILPPLTELAKPYWEGCREGVLRLQRCSACDRHQFYPRNICSHCGGGKLEWDTVSGQGKIASFTTVHRAISDSYTAPYTVALIDLEEGPRMMSNIVDTDPHSVVIGAAVIVDFETWSEDISLPVFRLEETGGQP
jgi:uncharacterized OB-fold protein